MLVVEHGTWLTKLQYTELAINTVLNMGTSKIFFMLVHRTEARLPIYLALSASGDILL